VPTNTLATLEQGIYDGLDNNTGLYAEPNIRAIINQGLWRLAFLTGYNETMVPVPGFSQAGKLIYQVPPGIVVPMRVYCEGRELSKCSLRELSGWFRNWSTDTTASLGPIARWCPIDTTQFIIHPMDAVGGNFLEVEGLGNVTALVNPGDEAPIDDEYADIVVDYGKSRARLKLTGKPFADAAVAYQDFIRKMKGMTIWTDMRFPRYWLDDEEEPAEGKGA
jgi:hypothetical protein